MGKTLTRKKPTPAKLKKELDRLFSIYIRTKYTVNGRLYCYTCDKPMDFSGSHCGHFIPRNILITRWNEDNCRPQCVGCNIFGNGKILDFEERLKKELGAAKVEKMKAKRHQIFKVDTNWYLERIAELK